MADRLGVETIDREGRTVVLKFRPQAKVDPVRLVALVRQRARSRRSSRLRPLKLDRSTGASRAELGKPAAGRAVKRRDTRARPTRRAGGRRARTTAK